MKKLAFERNMVFLAVGAFAIFAIGAIMTTVVPPLADKTIAEKPENLYNYTEAEQRGRGIYVREGCVYCHTQQIRDSYATGKDGKRMLDKDGKPIAITKDSERYGWRLVPARVSQSWEYANDRPHLLGTKRTGPDLARVGGKYTSEWHYAHFKDPRNMGEKFWDKEKGNVRQASLMQSFGYLTDKEIADLTAYIQTLGRMGRNIKGGDWRVDPKTGKPLNDYEE